MLQLTLGLISLNTTYPYPTTKISDLDSALTMVILSHSESKSIKASVEIVPLTSKF